ncbi:MAG TPA: aquaporin [Candidatus Acidoferrum sp.]|nr:aquaporin [Candidatus Acidoferrum sp.]
MKMGRRAYTAEFIGTFALVFFGSMSVTIFTAVVGLNSGAASLLGIAFAHGLILMAMVYAIGWISQCHINPAITITTVAIGKMDVDDGIGYLVAQVLGATVAGLANVLIQPGNGALTGYGAASPGAAIGGSDVMALIVEMIITFFLMFSVYAVLYTGKVHPAASGLLIGMTLMADILIAGPLTGAAANPAVALGPAIASGNFSTLWIYWVGPIIGALLAGFVWEYLLIERKKKK